MQVNVKGIKVYASPISGEYHEGGLKKLKVRILKHADEVFEEVAIWDEEIRQWVIKAPKKATKVKTKKVKS